MMIQQELKYRIVKSDATKIFILCMSMFLFVLLIKVYFQLNDFKPAWFAESYYPFFGISDSVSKTMQHGWVLLTHFLVEDDLLFLLTNSLWLYFFCLLLEESKPANTVFILFIISGILTGLVALILVGINPNFLPAKFYLGMKAPLMTIATAAILANPKRKVFESFNGGIPIAVAGVLFITLTLFVSYQSGLAAVVTIFSGIVVGIIFHYGLQKFVGKYADRLNDYQAKKDAKENENSLYTFEENGYQVVQVSQNKIDEILDKINAKGIQSISAQEKEWLKNYSNK
jgi:membrane associated rhomboid family serine protease